MNYLVTIISLLLLAGIACNNTQSNQLADDPEINDSFIKEVGHQVGNLSPNFEITLTNGETFSSSNLLQNRRPVFLFFFSPF